MQGISHRPIRNCVCEIRLVNTPLQIWQVIGDIANHLAIPFAYAAARIIGIRKKLAALFEPRPGAAAATPCNTNSRQTQREHREISAIPNPK